MDYKRTLTRRKFFLYLEDVIVMKGCKENPQSSINTLLLFYFSREARVPKKEKIFKIIFWPKLIFFPSCCQYCCPSGPARRPNNCALYRVLLLDIRLHLRICVSFAYGLFILVINLQLHLAWTPVFRIVIRNFMWAAMKQLHSTELWKISQIKIQFIQNTCSQQKAAMENVAN